jgi:hypothetical protein
MHDASHCLELLHIAASNPAMPRALPVATPSPKIASTRSRCALCIQLDNVIDCFTGIYPDDELWFLFDHSLCHDKTRDDSLSTHKFGVAQPFLQYTEALKRRGSEFPLYDSYAVSNHVGGLSSGHYTAFSLNRFDEQWYEYNDSTIADESSESTQTL